MRNLFFLFALSALMVSCGGKSTVTLSVKNSSGDIFCFMPIDNSVTVFANDTLYVATADTTFRFELQSDEMMYSNMFGEGLQAEVVRTVLGDDFSVFFDPLDTLNRVRFAGKNAKGRDLYNRISAQKNINDYGWIQDFTVAPLDTSAVVMRANFERMADAEVSRFDSLRQDGEIDTRFYDFVKSDIELYYRTVLSKVISAKYFRDSVLFSDYGPVWEQIYEQKPVSADLFRLTMGEAYTDIFLNSYIPYKTGQRHSFKSIGEHINQSRTVIDEHISDPLARRWYLMNWLVQLSVNNKTYEKAVVEQTDRFATEYPSSEINPWFGIHKKKVEDYCRIVAADFSPEMKFVEGYQQALTLREIIRKFEGRKLFIDFWFSTCGPCVQEFRHTGELKKFLREQDIDLLYISIDRPELEEKWQNAIKYYNLEGFHVRTSLPLHVDLYENYGIYSFPTYMIVNENGEIVEPRAKNPSSGPELIEQIREKLKLQ